MESYIRRGKLAPDSIVIGMIANYVADHLDAKGVHLRRIPRTTVQAEEFDKILAGHGLKVDIMVDIHVPEEGVGPPYPIARQGFRGVPTTLRRR